jgi:hypothetical protein
MTTPTQTLATFFQVVSPAGSTPVSQSVSTMQSLFVLDRPAPPPNAIYPNVGLTTGGPQFTGQVAVGVLFAHLFHCFPDMVFAPANGLRLTDGNNIAIEALLSTGLHRVGRPWAPGGHASPPISPIVPDGNHQSQNLPVCAVFTFNASDSLILNLALYFDRWKMAVGTPGSPGLWDHANPAHLA